MQDDIFVTIRTAQASQAGLIAGLIADLIAELSGGEEPDRAAMRDTATELLADGSVTGLLAYEGQKPVGLLMLNECAAIYAGGKFGEISELFVVPDRRSHGIAARLVAAARRFGENRGWTRLEVGAPDEQHWSRTKAFYEREGFIEVGPRLKRSLQP